MIFTFFDNICYFFYHLLTLSFLFFIFFIFIYYITQKDSKNCSKENFPRVCQILISSIFKKDAVTDYESKTNLLYSNFGHRCSLVSTVLCVPSFGLHFIEALVFPRWRVTQVKLSFEGEFSFIFLVSLARRGRSAPVSLRDSVDITEKGHSFFKCAYWYPGNWRMCTMCKRSVWNSIWCRL